jgi:hypothetical protein
MDPDIVLLGQTLREKVLREYQYKYRSRNYRLLFQIPSGGLGPIWFKDLMETLEFAGIKCASIRWNDPGFHQTWDTFRPNVFISLDIIEVLRSLDLEYIKTYKKNHGCFRLFTPIVKSRFPKNDISPIDKWRLNLACSGQSVDAYFSMYVDEFYDFFFAEWKEAGFRYLSLPHGCNPLYHYPRQGNREFDYFMATSYGHERVKLTWQYLKPIFEHHFGLWAGPGWGFGIGPVQSDELPDYYARTKIVPNPLARFLIHFPAEITERSFSATACGAFQITDWTPVTERFYSREEFVSVRGENEFLEAFNYYFNRPDERNAIIKKSMKRVFTNHTYFHRIDNLIAFLDQNQDLF